MDTRSSTRIQERLDTSTLTEDTSNNTEMENDDSLRSLVQVNSRNTVNEWRGDGNISEGAYLTRSTYYL